MKLVITNILPNIYQQNAVGLLHARGGVSFRQQNTC